MFKFIATLLFFFMYVSQTWGVVLIQRSVSAATCASQSTGFSQTSTDSAVDFQDGYVKGSSFVSSVSGDVYSVKVNISVNELDTAESDTLTCKIFSNEGGTTQVGGDATLVVSEGDTGVLAPLFSSANRPTIDDSSTYYAYCNWPRSYSDRLTISRNNVSSPNGRMYAGTSYTTMSVDDDKDLYLVVDLCDE